MRRGPIWWQGGTEFGLVPKVNARLILHVYAGSAARKLITNAFFVTFFPGLRKISAIEIDDINVPQPVLGREAKQAVPHRLRQSSRDQPAIGSAMADQL